MFITDHTPKPQKYNTTSPSEDLEFFQIKKAMEDYAKDASAPRKAKKKTELTLADIIDPLHTTEVLEDGAKYYKLEESDVMTKA